MNIRDTTLAGVCVIEPRVFPDSRGIFFESYNERTFAQAVGRDVVFVQDNHSISKAGVLRGLHYQIQEPQGKLVRVIRGKIFDVAVDLRRDSDTYGKWFGAFITAASREQIWIPEGLAHGFLVLEDNTEVIYKTTNYYSPKNERCIKWDDPHLSIDWPMEHRKIMVSEKDASAPSFISLIEPTF